MRSKLTEWERFKVLKILSENRWFSENSLAANVLIDPEPKKIFSKNYFYLLLDRKKHVWAQKIFSPDPVNTFPAMTYIYVMNWDFRTFLTFSALDIFLIEIALNKPSLFRKIFVWGFQKGLKLSGTTKIEGVMAFQSFKNFQWKSMIFGKLLGRERVNRPRTEKNFF